MGRSPIFEEKGRIWTAAGATALCFDDSHELVWVGRRDGYVEAHDLGTSSYDELHSNEAFLQRHCAFRQSFEASRADGNRVSSLIPLSSALGMQSGGVLSLSSTHLSMHTAGGVCLASAPRGLGKLASRRRQGGSTSKDDLRLDRSMRESDDFLSATFMGGSSARVAVGGQSDVIHILDVASGLRPIQAVSLRADTGVSPQEPALRPASRVPGAACLDNRAHRVLVAGGTDGKVRILDAQLRTQASVVMKAFEAYSGTVTAVACKGNIVVTAGSNVKVQRGGPYMNSHGQSRRMAQEPALKVFDLRTMRQLPPCPFMAGGAPLHLSAPTLLRYFPDYSPMIVAAAPGGAMLFLDPVQVRLCISLCHLLLSCFCCVGHSFSSCKTWPHYPRRMRFFLIEFYDTPPFSFTFQTRWALAEMVPTQRNIFRSWGTTACRPLSWNARP